jgi:hypothetical protein
MIGIVGYQKLSQQFETAAVVSNESNSKLCIILYANDRNFFFAKY